MPIRKSLSGNDFVESIPKKTYQGAGNILSMLLPVQINPKKGIEDKENNKGDLRVSFFA